MRKLILELAVSLDNRIEGPNGEYDWCFTDQDYGMTEFFESIDTIFYGRKSFEAMKKAGGDMFSGKKNYVFSTDRFLKYPDAEVIYENLETRVNAIKRSQGKDIWLFGGAVLTKVLLEMGLVDELRLSVHPIILGSGKLLFDNFKERIHTELLGSKMYSSGLVALKYKIRTTK